MSATLTAIPCADVDASPDQNRETFELGALEELARSIAELGLLQPITVRESGARYVLVAGERRLRACRDVLGWPEVPAIVTSDPADADAALRTLAENMVRVDPGPLEEARGLAAVGREHSLDAPELARRLGKSPRWVRDRLALLALADDVALYVQLGQLPLRCAVAMSALDVNRQRLALQAHEHGISPDGFAALVGRLLTDQESESMFDADSFLNVEEYVVSAEETAAADRPAPIRETPLGVDAVADLLDVRPATVHQWRQRGVGFPEPAGKIGHAPYWWETEILAWAASTGRLPD